MRRIGWFLIVMGFILAVAAVSFQDALGDGPAGVVAMCFSAAILLGLVLLTGSAMIRLWKGELRLRPWDGLKSAFLVFAAILTLRFAIGVAFPDLERDWVEIAWKSAAFAIVFGLYRTAYRKPA